MRSQVLARTMSNQLAGFLHRLDEEQSARDLLQSRAELSDWHVIIEGDWYGFTWKTPQGDVSFLLREGRDRFLLLANDSSHVSSLIEILGIAAWLRRPRVLVAKFVRDSVAPVNSPTQEVARKYRISNVFAAVEGYGRAVQTIGLWGDDLLNAELFLKLLETVRPYRLTVRELMRNNDVASIGSLGEVNFYYGGETQLKRVDAFFRHLKRGGYIRWGSGAQSDERTEADDGADMGSATD